MRLRLSLEPTLIGYRFPSLGVHSAPLTWDFQRLTVVKVRGAPVRGGELSAFTLNHGVPNNAHKTAERRLLEQNRLRDCLSRQKIGVLR